MIEDAERTHWTEQRGREVVYQRSGRQCEVCHRRRANGVHHRVKRSQGGTWNPANLLDVCGSGTVGCHAYIERNPTHAGHLGLGLRRDSDPAAHPMYTQPEMLWRDWWYVTPEGLWVWDADRSMHEHPPPAVLAAIHDLTTVRLT